MLQKVQNVKTIGQRENRWMQDVNHCISKALVERNAESILFILENLTGIRSETKKVLFYDRYLTALHNRKD